MAGNTIYRGPIHRQPRTVTKPVTGALLPGTFVEETATALAQITTAVAKRPLLLAPMDFTDQDILKAYVDGDTGVAYELQPNDRVQARMAAATYAVGAPLTVGAAGRLAAASAGSIVVAWFADTAGAYSAGAFADVIIANSYTAA
jgi:hypothetical protein